jgi:metallo-beta-lactamase family protein
LHAARGKAPRHVYINHGVPQVADTLRLRIQAQLGWAASVPDCKDAVDLT